jgi:hypothetical protein
MKEDNLKIWDSVARPPKEALKEIKGGRISGMTDIKPQWRYKAMTEQFGPCGIGWKYTITKEWTEQGSHEQVMCFVNIDLFYKHSEGWSEAIPGSGGSMLVTNESKGLHTSDEGFKMALTDALSVAMSRIGVAAEIYMGNWTGSKYKDQPKEEEKGNDTTIEILTAYLPSCKTTESLAKYMADNKKFVNSLFDKDKKEVIAEFSKRKVEITELGGSSQAQR